MKVKVNNNNCKVSGSSEAWWSSFSTIPYTITGSLSQPPNNLLFSKPPTFFKENSINFDYKNNTERKCKENRLQIR